MRHQTVAVDIIDYKACGRPILVAAFRMIALENEIFRLGFEDELRLSVYLSNYFHGLL
jgi:hypothetical protein